MLDLGKGFLYGVVIGGVGRQIDELTALLLYLNSLMRFGL
jgi:hypothetical protein